jgi:hypothetical protein
VPGGSNGEEKTQADRLFTPRAKMLGGEGAGERRKAMRVPRPLVKWSLLFFSSSFLVPYVQSEKKRGGKSKENTREARDAMRSRG